MIVQQLLPGGQDATCMNVSREKEEDVVLMILSARQALHACTCICDIIYIQVTSITVNDKEKSVLSQHQKYCKCQIVVQEDMITCIGSWNE